MRVELGADSWASAPAVPSIPLPQIPQVGVTRETVTLQNASTVEAGMLGTAAGGPLRQL